MIERNDMTAPPAGLLAVDIDGTLITDHGHITDEVQEALGRIAADGWEVVPATGRTYPAAKSVITQLPFVRYAVASNGSCIVDVRDDSLRHLEKLTPEQVDDVVRITREEGAIPALYTTDMTNQQVLYDTLEKACDFFAIYIREDSRTRKVDDVLDHADDVLQVAMIAARDIIFRVRDRLSEMDITVMALPFESPRFGGKSMDFWFIQVVAKQARKHLTLRKLADELNVPSGKLVAVGDNYNDMEMLATADVGVAMGNAPDEVKAHADVVVASNNDHGLAEAVERVILSGVFADGA